MLDDVNKIQNRISFDLGNAAQDYLKTGLGLFHSFRDGDSSNAQASVGNLCIAAELLIKSFVAGKNLGNIFKNLDTVMKVTLSAPETIPKFLNWRKVNLDTHSHEFQMIDLDECIKCYFIYFPAMKQPLVNHLELLTKWSHITLHSILPQLKNYDIERMVIAVLNIVSSISDNMAGDYAWYSFSKRDKEFLLEFEEKRRERVRMVMEQAKTIESGIDGGEINPFVTLGWDAFVVKCPVCSNSGIAGGYTEIAEGEDEEGIASSLDFFATDYKCDSCGLILHDSEEMKLAGMNLLYDRSDELERWFGEAGNIY